MEQRAKWKLTGQIQVLGEISATANFSIHKLYMNWPRIEPGTPRREAGDQQPDIWSGP
jgi:hypothetical protein